MITRQKIKILRQYFFMAGYGHFDLSNDEILIIFKILEDKKTNQEQKNKELKNYYDILSQKYLG